MAALSVARSPAAVRVGDYRVATGWVEDHATAGRWVALRAFTLNGVPHRLTVDPQTLSTRAIPAAAVEYTPRAWPELRAALATTPYGSALADASSHEQSRQGAGIVRVAADAGIDLTVDLCPSRHPLDRSLFSAVIGELVAVQRPVPVGVAVTGAWMKTHPQDLAWLADRERRGELAITWINHGFHHRVDARAPLARNFLLRPGANVRREVLGTEAALLAQGLTPSIFFRFPGLVSSPALVETVVGFGLVPTGSDAWLAKGETPRPGSIVLVHGTGNEPLGVRRFIDLLRRERAAVRARKWLLLDLRESVAATEAEPPVLRP